jgi:hypothetical protein
VRACGHSSSSTSHTHDRACRTRPTTTDDCVCVCVCVCVAPQVRRRSLTLGGRHGRSSGTSTGWATCSSSAAGTVTCCPTRTSCAPRCGRLPAADARTCVCACVCVRADFCVCWARAYAYGPAWAQVRDMLLEHTPPASLLHGDLWTGNGGATDKGEPVIFVSLTPPHTHHKPCAPTSSAQPSVQCIIPQKGPHAHGCLHRLACGCRLGLHHHPCAHHTTP